MLIAFHTYFITYTSTYLGREDPGLKSNGLFHLFSLKKQIWCWLMMAFGWGVVKWCRCREPVISSQLIWAGHWIKLVRVLWVHWEVLETQTGSKGVVGNSVLSEHWGHVPIVGLLMMWLKIRSKPGVWWKGSVTILSGCDKNVWKTIQVYLPNKIIHGQQVFQLSQLVGLLSSWGIYCAKQIPQRGLDINCLNESYLYYYFPK